jgi:hypothetical protein
MNPPQDPVEAIARAVLYEGYLLYPYRQSAAKNQVRWTFGGVHPREWSEATGGWEPWLQQAQCLVDLGGQAAGREAGEAGAELRVEVRFLHLLECCRGDEPSWQEATERRVQLPPLGLKALLEAPHEHEIDLAGGVEEGEARREWRRLRGAVEIEASPAGESATRIMLRVRNSTAVADPGRLARHEAVLYSMASTHAVLRVSGARFISLSDPPAALAEAARSCENVGVWPVLVGDPGAADTVLASPIILEDYPQIALESPIELFDSTEIDEILTLRILTLSDTEKTEMRAGDERARRLLERAEALTAEQLMQMHGSVRSLRPLAPGQ